MFKKMLMISTLAVITMLPVVRNAFALQNIVASQSVTQVVKGDLVSELGDNLMRVYQDRNHHYWFATWGDGLYRYDGKSIDHFTTKHGLCHNRVDEIVEDDAGILYFNTGAGVSRFDGKAFATLPIAMESTWKLQANDLWFKSPQFSGLVYRFDGQRLCPLQLPKLDIGEKFVGKNPGASSPYGVYTIFHDSHGHVWFGTAALGVCRYDGKTFDWICSDDVNELHDGPANGVRSIAQDQDGRFWFNTKYRYRVQSHSAESEAEVIGSQIYSREPGIGSLDGMPNGSLDEFISITVDSHGDIWIATHGNGVFYYDGATVKHYPVTEGAKVVRLFSIFHDRNGCIWLGTHEHGAYHFEKNRFVRFQPSGLGIDPSQRK